MKIDTLTTTRYGFSLRTRPLPKSSSSRNSSLLLGALIGCGVVLRLALYLSNRSLWWDEAALALNIINRPFSKLLQPLDYNQAAPIGFLWLEKAVVHVLGDSEYALRLLPLICGLASLFLFYKVAQHCLEPKAIPLALVLFAFSDYLIYYSSEAKQYSSDVAITLTIFAVTFDFFRSGINVTRAALLGTLGAMAVWFSHPAVFVLVGISLYLVVNCLFVRGRINVGPVLITLSLWGLGFASVYFASLRETMHHRELLAYWGDVFMPFPPSSLSDIWWFFRSFHEMLGNPLGLHPRALVFVVLVVGSISFWRDKWLFGTLVSPALMGMLASGLHKYPFGGRLLLFFVPSLLIITAKGAMEIWDRTRGRLYKGAIGVIVILMIVINPLFAACYQMINPRARQDVRPAVEYIVRHKESEDVLYIYHDADHPFEYYAQRLGLNINRIVLGERSRDGVSTFIIEVAKLQGNKRVWFLFSHIDERRGTEDEMFIIQHLDRASTRIDLFEGPRARVYLYDLRNPA